MLTTEDTRRTTAAIALAREIIGANNPRSKNIAGGVANKVSTPGQTRNSREQLGKGTIITLLGTQPKAEAKMYAFN
jgi:hypothetical protein